MSWGTTFLTGLVWTVIGVVVFLQGDSVTGMALTAIGCVIIALGGIHRQLVVMTIVLGSKRSL